MRSTNKISQAERRFLVEALWDISKAFDRVRHARLQELATELGYPMSVLTMWLHSYTWPRKFVVDTTYTRRSA